MILQWQQIWNIAKDVVLPCPGTTFVGFVISQYIGGVQLMNLRLQEMGSTNTFAQNALGHVSVFVCF